MYVYCLFCVTQRCAVIAKLMEVRGAYRAFSPRIIRKQRKKGENIERSFDLLPGYVFIYSEERLTDYRAFFGIDGVIRRVGRRDDGYELEGPDLDFAMKLLEKDGIDFREAKDANVLSLAVHRFQSVRRTGTGFERDENLVLASQNGNIFDVPTIAKVRLKLTGKSRIYGGELFPGASLIEQDDKNIVLELHNVEEYRIVNFVLCSQGEVKLLSPDSLKGNIAQVAKKIARMQDE